jgi:hypothetical protein
MEMRAYGVDVIALDGQSNDTHAGRAMNRMMGVFSEFQRDDLVQTMRQGKLGAARAGRIMPGRYAPYGFVYDANTRSYKVDDDRMTHLRRAFEMIGLEGRSMRAVKMAFERNRVPTPSGGRFWHAGRIREMIHNDVYEPHDRAELATLVAKGQLAQQVFDGLDPEKRYGIQWYGRNRWEHDADVGDKKHLVTPNGEAEWIAVPVPNAGVPRAHVDAARAAIRAYVRPSRAGGREWELKGLLYCPCGCRMHPHTVRHYNYYVCSRWQREGAKACEHGKNWRAEQLEQDVRRFALKLIRNPEVLREQVQAEVERWVKARGTPKQRIKACVEVIASADRMRDNYREQQARGYMSFDELGGYLAELNKQKTEAKRELESLRGDQRHLEYLNHIPTLVEEHLRDLPDQFARPIRKLPDDADDRLRRYKVTRETAKPRVEREIDQEAESRKWRGLYEDLGLRLTKHRVGVLEAFWGPNPLAQKALHIGEAHGYDSSFGGTGKPRTPEERGRRWRKKANCVFRKRSRGCGRRASPGTR